MLEVMDNRGSKAINKKKSLGSKLINNRISEE